MTLFNKILLLPLFLLSLLAPVSAFALVTGDYGFDATAKQAGLSKTVAGATTITGVIGKVVGVGLSGLGIIFFILVLYAGFNWMTAMGNSEKVDKSKQILEGAIIGLVLVMAAYAITSFVFISLDQGPTAASAP